MIAGDDSKRGDDGRAFGAAKFAARTIASSKELRVDMAVPVFYKREGPAKNVSIYTADCELRSD